MPFEISVGPPILTINQGSTFMVTDLNGEIVANGQPWARLASSVTTYSTTRIYLGNQPFATEEGDVPGGTLMLTISRAIAEGIHEDFDLVNYGLTPVRFNLQIALGSDFADLFEVKSHRFVPRGRIVTEWREDAG